MSVSSALAGRLKHVFSAVGVRLGAGQLVIQILSVLALHLLWHMAVNSSFM